MKNTKAIATSPLLGGTKYGSQITLERQAVQEGITRYRRDRSKSEKRGEAGSLAPGQRWMNHWYLPVALQIRQTQRNLKSDKELDGKSHLKYGAAFLILSPKKLATIAMNQLLGCCIAEPNGTPLVQAARIVGRAVVAEAQMQLWKSDEKYKETLTKLFRVQKRYKLTSDKVQWFAKLNDPETIFDDVSLCYVGSELIWHVVHNASAGGYDTGQFRFAFHYSKRNEGFRQRKMIELDTDVFRAISQDHVALETLRPIYPPMTVPPFEWKDNRGGYIELKTSLIKKSTKEQRQAVADNEANMGSFYECLATLGQTPLRVDKENYAVVKALYEEGGGVLNIPRRDDWEIGPRLPETSSDDQIRERKREAAILHKKNVELLSTRCAFLATMGMAEKTMHWPSLYFPHSCDFRSRSYPIPMYLNHHGDDLPRGLLEFSDAVPCDKSGMRNVAIQAANLWKHGGIDKLPFDERVEWTLDHMNQILASAHDPLQFRWWMEAKKPLQFLAACRALRDPEKASRIMFGLDGTFNGLQNYAAISRDEECARLSNLINSDTPVVAYRMVATRVVELLKESGEDLAARLAPHVDADMVKQPAMTTMYGVTEIGAREQVEDKIADVGFEGKEWFAASRLLAKTTLAAIGDLFAGAAAYMDYLKDVAKEIANDGHPVSWNTALGFPVVQSYRKTKTRNIVTSFGYLNVATNSQLPVRTKKQSTACPPNFIHSVDATHLLMTARACSRAGIAFAGVHDGFKSHAQHGGQLGRIIREQFVSLHDGPGPLWAAVDRWRTLYPNLYIPDPPARGGFDMKSVLAAQYAFS